MEKLEWITTKQKCTCGWPIGKYISGTLEVKCLDCKSTIKATQPKLTEYELWVQSLKND